MFSLAAVTVAACSSSGPPDTTGSSGGRGETSSGGATGTGGATSTGGRPGSGGNTGGNTSSGGGTGTGGVRPGTGGSGTGGGSGTRGPDGGASGGAGNATGGTGGAGGAASACPAATPWSGGTTYSSNSLGTLANGYAYQLWSNGVGSGSMTVAGVDAKFSATWNDPGDFLARIGLTWDASKTYSQLGTISSDFAETKTGSGIGYNFIGIYGWSEDPLHEYYIVEDWFGSRPAPGTKVGSITVDGGTYDVLTNTQTNQPSVFGTLATFVQFYSVRQAPRSCGHVSISQHFTEWANLGLQLGKMEEAKILVEVGNGGTGTITFTTAKVAVR